MQKIEFYVGTVDQSGATRDLSEVDKFLGDNFEGFTRTMGVGYWEGQTEAVAVYTVILMEGRTDSPSVSEFAEDIAKIMGQRKVLWTLQTLGYAGLSGRDDGE